MTKAIADVECNSFCLVLPCVRKKLPDAATVISQYMSMKKSQREKVCVKNKKKENNGSD